MTDVELRRNDVKATEIEFGSAHRLPDGSGFCVASWPLSRDHWLLVDGRERPPAPFRKGTDDPERRKWIKRIEKAAKWAIRATTSRGTVDDIDPDAFVRNVIIGLLGYYTPDGKSHVRLSRSRKVRP